MSAGSLACDGSVDGQAPDEYLVFSKQGQVFSISSTDQASARVLAALEGILARHPATRCVNAFSHKANRGYAKGAAHRQICIQTLVSQTARVLEYML